MITNTGKNILAKYLIGQAPAYASFIAIGCGAKPLALDADLGNYSQKESLDFEMFRIPITSRGYVVEDGQSKIVLTAELPTEERYEITEVGIWSAGSNPTAASYDSKTVYSFNDNENWEYHNASSAVSIQQYYSPLDSEDNVINIEDSVFYTNADNRIFTNQERENRYERCRFLNNILVVKGNLSNISIVDNRLSVPANSEHIHLTAANLDFNKNAPTDDLRLAFSVINKDGESLEQPDEVRILLEFAETDVYGSGEYARFETVIKESDLGVDFATNRYFISVNKLEELYKSSGFTWNVVDVVKFYASVIKDEEISEDYYVCLDALRLENTTSRNPVYGLSGYSVIKNLNSKTITKAANTTNYIEFRFGMDVL
jgi:hypothetical protein